MIDAPDRHVATLQLWRGGAGEWHVTSPDRPGLFSTGYTSAEALHHAADWIEQDVRRTSEELGFPGPTLPVVALSLLAWVVVAVIWQAVWR